FESPFSDFESNSTQLFKVLDNIRLHAPLCKVVHFSSAAVYGNPDTLPIDENIKPNPLSVYGFHKLISENIANEFYKIYGVKSICLRPFSVYGPGQKKLLFWDIYKKHMNEESIKLFGTGNETRDFIYIEDLILALELCMNNAEFNAQSINIACGNEISIREAATIFCKALETDKALIFSNNVKKGDPLRWKADISKL
ncbi:MAG: NAD-dependent epimerase/dehydratase family protein, partial [Bacteroidota bacterium]